MKTPPKLVIFDCDGVLVDSEPIVDAVNVEMIREQGGGPETEALVASFAGGFMADILVRIEDFLGAPLPEGFESELRRRGYDRLAREVQAIDGVHDLLDRLDGAGIPYCVGSNGPQIKMRTTLTATALYDRMAGRIFSAYDSDHPPHRPKPHPDLYLRAAAAMGVAPAECLVIDDTPTGASAGVAAGMKTIGFALQTDARALEAVGAIPIAGMADIAAAIGL
ncbi:MAG: HAD family phosphatase [Alphaproteobacteria bacterium]|nr:HAD family phosphatase [Alphaproteobacteria bacterium]